MSISKKEINESGDYQIIYNGSPIRCKGVLQTYTKDEELTEKLSPVIIGLLNSNECEVIPYTPAEETLSSAIESKLFELREKRNGSIDFNGISINVSDINIFTPILLLDESKISSKLPIETDSGFFIETVEQLRGICELYVNHIKTYTQKIVDCQKAKTIADVDKITV